MSPLLEIFRMQPYPKKDCVIDVPFPARNHETKQGTINIEYSTTKQGDQIRVNVSGIKDVPSIVVNVSPKTGEGVAKFGISQGELKVRLKPEELEYLRQI